MPVEIEALVLFPPEFITDCWTFNVVDFVDEGIFHPRPARFLVSAALVLHIHYPIICLHDSHAKRSE